LYIAALFSGGRTQRLVKYGARRWRGARVHRRGSSYAAKALARRLGASGNLDAAGTCISMRLRRLNISLHRPSAHTLNASMTTAQYLCATRRSSLTSLFRLVSCRLHLSGHRGASAQKLLESAKRNAACIGGVNAMRNGINASVLAGGNIAYFRSRRLLRIG
jgi:hypothetical protein